MSTLTLMSGTNDSISQYQEEPTVNTWHIANDAQLKDIVTARLPSTHKHLILIDGRSGNGKSTFAKKIATMFNASIVHTDDLAWHYHPINWDGELMKNIIDPWLTGKNVTYQPPGWLTMNRHGYIQVAAKEALVIEGVGAGRARFAAYNPLIIWVQADNQIVYTRAIQRDMAIEARTRQQAIDFWTQWKLQEDPFLARDRPWTRAQLIINGTPPSDAQNSSTYFTYGPLQ